MEHSDEAVSTRVRADGVRRWHADNGGTVAYVDTGSAWVAIGSPSSPADQRAETARAFARAASLLRRRACFFAVEDMSWTRELRTLVIGCQPVFDGAAWPAVARQHRSLREQLRRARAKGVVVRELDAAELVSDTALAAEISDVARAWLAGRRMEPMGFVVALEVFRPPQRSFVASYRNRIVAFAAVRPTAAGGRWFVEDIVRRADAPNGTTELVFELICRTLGGRVTLGLAPLSGGRTWQRLVALAARPMYDFVGLERFKRRLHPLAWQNVWLVAANGTPVWCALADCLRAFAGRPLWRFGLATLVRRPGALPYVLALPLVPWTLVLYALAATGQVGPLGFSGQALWGWSLFDSVLIVAMLAAAVRPRARLLLLLATAATLDACVSVAHVWRVGMGTNLVVNVLRAVATAAPLIAAVALAWAALLCLKRRTSVR